MTDLSESKNLVYKARHKIRFVTAASLFDGHDASINIMRRILQASGAEVIHLGHNRSVEDVVSAALEEDVQGIAVSSYQGGHIEYFRYMIDLLRERGGEHIRVFGGGGGVIVPDEIQTLHEYGVARIYSPEDGQKMGLQGMINDMLAHCDFDPAQYAPKDLAALKAGDRRALAQVITALELGVLDEELKKELLAVAIQHEMDHLEGRLFIDRLSPLKKELAQKKLRKERVERDGFGTHDLLDPRRAKKRGV